VSAEKNLAVHAAWSDAENRHDLSHLEDFLHRDFEEHLSADEVVVGIDAYRAGLESLIAAFPDFQIDLDDRFATEDRVVCRWRMSGTHQGGFYGFPPSGNRVEWAGISIWEFENGRARRGWVMQDINALMAQLGVANA
jgi:steroid delta-isomerase-like uncharacterized protein